MADAIPNPQQLLDFEVELDFHLAVKRAAAQDLAACRLSRTQVAEALTRLTHQSVSEDHLNQILAQGKPHRLPAAWIPAWRRITGSARLVELLCKASGVLTCTEDDRRFAELGRAHLAEKKAAAEKARLEQDLA